MSKIYRNKTIKDEGFPEAISMDDIEDGTVYRKINRKYVDDDGNIKAKSILLSEVIGSLDDIADGVYGKVLKTSITAGKIILTEVTGTSDDLSEGTVNKWDTGVPPADLDALADGATYGRYLNSALSAGKALLSQAVGDLDDIADGTYGKVLVTDISAGHILLAATTGDLDDIANGSNYGKVSITDIQSGHILLSTVVGTSDDISEGSGNFFAGVSGADFRKTIDTLDNVLNGSNYGKIAITDIQSGHILLGTAVGNLDDVDNGSTYNKVRATDIYAGHINLIERTTSSRSISLDASVPHVKVSYNNSDVIQMCVVGSEPKLEIYNGGYIRTRLNKNGIYIFTTSGSQMGRIYGDSSGNQTIFYGNEFYVNAALSTSGSVSFGGSGSNNTISGDGTAIVFNGLSNAHLVPDGSLVNSAQLGTSSNYWGKAYVGAYYGKSTTITSFDKYDDLQILRNLKTSKVNVDVSSLPKEIISKEGFCDMNSLAGFSLCASKMIVKAIDDLNNRLKALEK